MAPAASAAAASCSIIAISASSPASGSSPSSPAAATAGGGGDGGRAAFSATTRCLSSRSARRVSAALCHQHRRALLRVPSQTVVGAETGAEARFVGCRLQTHCRWYAASSAGSGDAIMVGSGDMIERVHCANGVPAAAIAGAGSTATGLCGTAARRMLRPGGITWCPGEHGELRELPETTAAVAAV